MSEQLKATIEVSIAPRQGAVGAWNVEAIDEDGSIEQAIFAGPNAERRARSYAELQYTRAPVQSDDADYLRKLALGHSPGVARRLERIAARLTRSSPEADALRCEVCGQGFPVPMMNVPQSYMGTTDGKVYHAGCWSRRAALARTPAQEGE